MLGRMRWGLIAGTAALACWTGSASAAGPGETTLVGGLPLPPGAIAGGPSGRSDDQSSRTAVSQDGRYVAFVSDADALSTEAALDVTNVYRKDRVTGEVLLVSRATGVAGPVAGAPGRDPAISADGTRVAWITRASLDGGDADGLADVYVRDLATARTTLATPGTSADPVESMDFSGNGQHVAFATAARLAPVADANTHEDVYARDLAGATTTLVSWNDLRTRAGDRASGAPSISDDGRWIAFHSEALDLVPAFSPRNVAGATDVFARDTNGAGRTYLVSRRAGAAGNEGGDGESGIPVIAGRPTADLATVHVAYSSRGTSVGPGDGSITESAWVRTLSRTESTLISLADGGANANGRAYPEGISDDGRRIIFTSAARNLGGPPEALFGVYARDLATSRTARVSAGELPDAYGVQGAISGDGSTTTWMSAHGETPDADPDLSGVWARAYPAGPPQLVSRPPGDAPYVAPAFAAWTAEQGDRGMSVDGRYVVAATNAQRVTGVPPDSVQIVRIDTLTGAIEVVSRGTGSDGPLATDEVIDPSISADGNRVAFRTFTSFDPADAGGSSMYVRDIAAATTTLVSRADGVDGPDADDGVEDGTISADGMHVAFTSDAGNLGFPAGPGRVYLRDLASHTTRLVSRGDGDGAAGPGWDPSISADGSLVVFVSDSRLDADDVNGVLDVFVRDVATGDTRLVSRRDGVDGALATSNSGSPAISADGRVVAFSASDETLAPEAGPWGGADQVVARDLATDANTLVSRAPGGAPADANAGDASVDADGSTIAFASTATNLLAARGGSGRRAVFVRDGATGELSGPPAFGVLDNEPVNGAFFPAVSDDGQCVAFTAQGHNAGTGAAGDLPTVYVYTVAGVCPKPLPPRQDPPRGDPPRPDPPRGDPPRQDPPRGGVQSPRLTAASLLRKKFRVARGATAKVAARDRGARGRARRTPAGTAFRFTLNARANVTIAFERKAKGRKVGKACRRPSARLRRRRPCIRWVAVRAGSLVRNGVEAGRQSVAFSGRIGRAALAPGAYRATLRASNAAGSSPVVRLAFTVVRR